MAETVEYEIHSLAAGVYKPGHFERGGTYLTHAMVGGHPLCGRVKKEHLLDDTCEPAYQKNAGEPTCRICTARLRKLLKKNR